MSIICRKFLQKLALKTQTFLKRGHTSTLSIWTEEVKAKSEEEPRKQQLTVTLSDYKHLADTKQFFGKYKNLYVTVPLLPCFVLYFRALSKYKPPGAYIRRGDLTEGFLRYEFEGLIFGGAYTWRGLFSEFHGSLSNLILKCNANTFVKVETQIQVNWRRTISYLQGYSCPKLKLQETG